MRPVGERHRDTATALDHVRRTAPDRPGASLVKAVRGLFGPNP
jgi:hypothetical protein